LTHILRPVILADIANASSGSKPMWKGNVVRIYTGADNRSHFEDLSITME
jgi:hypothetical protein